MIGSTLAPIYAMPSYRIYTLSKDDHVRAPPQVIDCADDSAAVATAKQLLDGQSIEVWNDARLVKRLEPKARG